MAAIDPNQIPGEDPKLDPDAVEAAARALRADAEAIRESGGEVVDAWSRLREDYQAPESEQLLRSLDPVRTATATVGDDLGRAAAALMTFAGELREIKAQFDRVRADAFAFKDRIRSNPEWEFDQALIDENTALLGRVNSTQVQLWDAERECANAIRAIDDIKRWHSGFAEGDQDGYGLSSIPTGTEMPWGAPVEKQEHCPMSAAIAVKSAVWDGFGHDVIVEGFKGLGGLIGLGDDGFSMETFESTWGGMGALIGRDVDTGEWAWSTAGDAWLETGKSLVAWDMWAEDPARATGTTLGNIALTVATMGTGAAIKGVASAGRAGQVLSVAGQALRVVGKAMDPVELLVGGAKVLKGVNLVNTFEAARFHSILNTDEILKGLEFDPDVDMTMPEPDGLDTPLAENSASNSTRESVREPALVGAVTRNTNEAGQAGSHVSVDQPSTGGGHGGGTSSGGGGTGDAPSVGGGHGGGADGPRVPEGSPEAPGNSGRDEGPPRSVPSTPMGDAVVRDLDSAFDGRLDEFLAEHSVTRSRFEDLVNTPIHELTRPGLEKLIEIRQDLPPVQSDTVLQKVVTPDVVHRIFTDLIDTADVSDPKQMARLFDLVETHDDVISDVSPNERKPTTLGGFVTRAADLIGKAPAEIYQQLGLDYKGTPFRPGDKFMFGIEFQPGHRLPDTSHYVAQAALRHFDELHDLPPEQYRSKLLELIGKDYAGAPGVDSMINHGGFALDPRNPYRGNGFSGSGGNLIKPEFQYFDYTNIPDGSELWRVGPDGAREIVAGYSRELQQWVLR